ncbi:MAG TPA: copper transporter [Candidatus Atribacteria bacterium]|nr:copper transporter [Candidatus Atribacteria bacterium]HPT77902.1 copper transporter [Candidatus Atribacteria bacterium]
MVNIKYYVFLMTGIFLALGLGMMIGITLEDKNVIENQQMLLVNQIEERILYYKSESEKLKQELDDTQAEHKQLEQLADMLLAEATANRLAGLNIALISFNDKADTDYLVDLLTHAGASIRFDIALSMNYAAGLLSIDPETMSIDDNYEIVHAIINDLVYCLNFGGTTPLIQEMHELGIIENNYGYEAPADSVILLCDGNATSTYDTIFISYMLESGLPVVAVESGRLDNSAVGDYKTLGISTIDHIDTLYGRLSLISVLTGRKGCYGYGSHADALVPDPIFGDYLPDLEDQGDMAASNGGSQN